ncbi:SHOCT domain-containing protein [Nocardioides sp. YR527]|uniref:SHOCT domain-containing protein n=1 Tax=Nocardioides sp. YR527 TaxID=1881028 RepID=UPI000B8876CB|nr:SHOCT domain-containing protein [Nocardioides sp. YR527]
MGMGGMWLWTTIGLIGLIGLWVLVACAIAWVVGPRRTGAAPDALEVLEVLEARLARGEITAEEYRRIRRLIATGH